VTYQWLILQDGQLPLAPDRTVAVGEHICTATLIWPDGRQPTMTSSLVIDPCFSRSGWRTAVERLAAVDASPQDIGYYFESHPHSDHALHVPAKRPLFGLRARHHDNWQRLAPESANLPGIEFVSCPGHSASLHAVRFRDRGGEVWIAADAVLNRDWLVAWEYYWPNVYSEHEIIATWSSVAKIVAKANIIIPGHGLPITVDAVLLHDLAQRFPQAEYASQCPDVLDVLRARREKV
jgi:glyoxylase-like metal-dependent hydrolase (beta-lactamase superfamily II)